MEIEDRYKIDIPDEEAEILLPGNKTSVDGKDLEGVIDYVMNKKYACSKCYLG